MELPGYFKKSQLTAKQRRSLGEPDFTFEFASNRNPAHFYSKRRKTYRSKAGEALLRLDDAACKFCVSVKDFEEEAQSLPLLTLDRSDRGWTPVKLISESKSIKLIQCSDRLSEQHLDSFKGGRRTFAQHAVTKAAIKLMKSREYAAIGKERARQEEILKRKELYALAISGDLPDLINPSNLSQFIAGDFSFRLNSRLSEKSKLKLIDLFVDSGAEHRPKRKNGKTQQFRLLLSKSNKPSSFEAFLTLNTFLESFEKQALATHDAYSSDVQMLIGCSS